MSLHQDLFRRARILDSGWRRSVRRPPRAFDGDLSIFTPQVIGLGFANIVTYPTTGANQ